MNGRNPMPSSPDFSPLDDTEDLPTGIRTALVRLPPEARHPVEIVYREHRWNHRFLRDLASTLRTIKMLMYLVPLLAGAGVSAVEGIRYVWTHWHW